MAAGAANPPARDPRSLGRELFARTWLANDPRCHGGDGLGPVYNATSCVDCHNQGGPGGGGPADRNVQLAAGIGYMIFGDTSVLVDRTGIGWNFGLDLTANKADLISVHPRFRDASAVVLHRFGVDPNYSRWYSTFLGRCRTTPRVKPSEVKMFLTMASSAYRSRHARTTDGAATPAEQLERLVLGPNRSKEDLNRELVATMRDVENGSGSNRVAFRLTARNSPPLFGAGLIDGLSDSELEQSAEHQPSATRGHVHWLKDGRVGRFGWKAQVASLDDFVLMPAPTSWAWRSPATIRPSPRWRPTRRPGD